MGKLSYCTALLSVMQKGSPTGLYFMKCFAYESGFSFNLSKTCVCVCIPPPPPPSEIHFLYLGNKKCYCISMTCSIMSVLFFHYVLFIS